MVVCVRPKHFDQMYHPLRILSEENLTVVSTFVADVNDLESIDDEVECDPSKLSFFEVPEFTICNNAPSNECPDDHYFETRLKELSKIASKDGVIDCTKSALANTNIDLHAKSNSVSNDLNEEISDTVSPYGN